ATSWERLRSSSGTPRWTRCRRAGPSGSGGTRCLRCHRTGTAEATCGGQADRWVGERASGLGQALSGAPSRGERRHMAAFTRTTQRVRAPRGRVYQAILDPEAVAVWLAPPGMRSQVLTFDPREGGTFRISLTYESQARTGRSTGSTDTFQGRFIELVPPERVVQVVEFETDDPSL